MSGQVFVVIRLYLYGDAGPATVQREEPVWRKWINQLFPTPQ